MLALYLVPSKTKYTKLFQFMPSVSGPILPPFYNFRKMELEVTSQCHPVNSRASYLLQSLFRRAIGMSKGKAFIYGLQPAATLFNTLEGMCDSFLI